MQYYKLQNSDISISRMGFGCASFWAHNLFSYKKAERLINVALDNGINYFDTGHSYAKGEAEPRLGNILKRYRRESFVISSKIGSYHYQNKILLNFDNKFLTEQLDKSLSNLKIDHIDILYLHGPQREHLTDELWEFVNTAKSSGKIKAIGLNSFSDLVIKDCLANNHIDVYMIDYNIVNPSKIKHFGPIKAKGRDIIVAAPLASNYIDKNFLRINSIASIWYIFRAYLRRNNELQNAKKLHNFFEEFPGVTPQRIALAYVLMNNNITSAVIGCTKEKHLLENIRNCKIDLSEDIMQKLCERENEFK